MSWQDDKDEPTTPDVLDLDALEAEGSEKKAPPYRFKIGGETYHMINAEDLDYRDLLEAYRAANTGDFEVALRLLLPDDERESFFEQRIKASTLEVLFDRYTKHFGLAQGKGSRRSLPR